jgi:hypothetical protein
MKTIALISISFFFILATCTTQTQWEKFELLTVHGYYATSSELDAVDPHEGLGKYGGFNLFDRDPATAWVEAVEGDGIGETFTIGIGEELKENIYVLNGYQKSRDLFAQNNRIKTLRLSLYVGFMIPGELTEIYAYFHVVPVGEPEEIHLEDKYGLQTFTLPFDITAAEELKKKQMAVFREDFKTRIEEIQNVAGDDKVIPEVQYFLKCVILDVYKGSKYDDTCISDIWIGSKEEMQSYGIAFDETITDVYKDDDEGMIYVNTNKRGKIILADETALEKEENLVEGEHLYLEIMEVSPDKEWVQISYMYRHEGEGRIESIPHLYSVRFLCHVDKSFLRNSFGLYGFHEEDGKIYIDTDYGLVDLDEVAEELRKSQPPAAR